MANYLMKSEGASAITSTDTLGRDDIINVDNMYRCKIYNKSGTIQFSGFIPPDFSISLDSNWTSPFTDTTANNVAQNGVPTLFGGLSGTKAGQRLDQVQAGITMAGGSSFIKMFSAMKWSGPSYFSLDLPIFLDAYTNTRTEVHNRIFQLLCLCAPSEKAGVLIPPGPAPINEIVDSGLQSLGQLTGKDLSSAAPDDSESFTVEIGNFLKMSPCIVRSVNANMDNVFEDGTGLPISADFNLAISSYFAVTREDLKKWLNITGDLSDTT